MPDNSIHEMEDEVDSAPISRRVTTSTMTTDGTQTECDDLSVSVTELLDANKNNDNDVTRPPPEEVEVNVEPPQEVNEVNEDPPRGIIQRILSFGSVFQRSSSATRRTVSTQTYGFLDQVIKKGQQLSILIIQEYALGKTIAGKRKDAVFNSLSYCVCNMLHTHEIPFNVMVRNFSEQNPGYNGFAAMADELFEVDELNIKITWARIASLFAISVRLAKAFREIPDRVEAITRYLSTYITKYVARFVREQGGWENLVKTYPPPEDPDAHFNNTILWTGLCCVGLVASVFVMRR